MSLRLAIVEADPESLNVTEFCRQHGISTWFFWQLRRRFEREGESALEPKSRAPRVVANRTPAEAEDRIVAKRKELLEAGLDAGPASIHDELDGDDVPSESTIWRVLTRRGFIVPEPKKAPKHSYRRFTAERANECWQIDDYPWLLADGSEVRIINIIDDCTRVLIASRAVRTCTGAAALDAFVIGAEQWGWPERFLSDNAKAFRFTLAAALAPLGIRAGHSRPHHPQTCGKCERYHQTEQRFLRSRPPSDTLEELQDHLDEFRDTYNHRRRHRSLERQRPAEVWATTPKSGPAATSIAAPTAVHRNLVQPNGLVRMGRHHRISLGAAYAGNLATIIATATACHVFIDGRLVRQLTLDHTRNIQTLYDRPGRPKRPADLP